MQSCTLIFDALYYFIHAVGLEIVAHPSSLLVPINEIAVFSCKACSCFSCSGYWIINNSYTEPPDEFIAKGYSFPPMQNYSDELLMTLLVNASEEVNNSVISCEFDPSGGVGSRIQSRSPATLLVIAGKKSKRKMIILMNLYFKCRLSIVTQSSTCKEQHTCDSQLVSTISMARTSY